MLRVHWHKAMRLYTAETVDQDVTNLKLALKHLGPIIKHYTIGHGGWHYAFKY